MRIRVVAGCLFVALFAGGATHADAAGTIDAPRLAQLYEEYLAGDKTNPSLEERIRTERARVRSIIDEELNALINSIGKAQTGASLDIASSVERQKTTVNTLEERLRETNVDLELLAEEEQAFYLQPRTGTGAEGEFRLTQTYSELLARKAILEERSSALEFFLIPQRERLRKLTVEQRFAQFALIISIGKYAGLILAIILIERFLRLRLLTRIRFSNPNRRYAVMKSFASITYGVLTVYLLSKLSTEYPGIITSFAIVGAGIAVALQDIVKDVVGWMLIAQGRRIALGHRITIGQWTGDVIDIGLLRTTLLEVATEGSMDLGRTGKTLSIPNSFILTHPLVNYNTASDYIRVEMSVMVTYGSDLQKARSIVERILAEETEEFTRVARAQQGNRMRQFYFAEEVAGSTVYTVIADSGVVLTLRFYVPIGQRRMILSKISDRILAEFAAAEPKIEIAYKTSRAYVSSLDPAPQPESPRHGL